MDYEVKIAQRLGEVLTAQTAINEELAGRSSPPDLPVLAVRVSGRRSGGDTNHVLNLWLRHAEIVRDVREGVARDKAVDEILDPCSPMDNERHPKRSAWIDYDLRLLVDRQANARGPAIIAVGDSFEVVAHDLSELSLAGAYHCQAAQLLVLLAGCVVVEHLRTVGIQLLGRQCVLDPDPGGEHLYRRPDALHRYTRPTECGQDVSLGEADARRTYSLPRAGKHVMTGIVPPAGRAQLCNVEGGSPR